LATLPQQRTPLIYSADRKERLKKRERERERENGRGTTFCPKMVIAKQSFFSFFVSQSVGGSENFSFFPFAIRKQAI
jgi:hypothetical protein